MGWLIVGISLTLIFYVGESQSLGGSIKTAAFGATGAVIGARIVDVVRSRRFSRGEQKNEAPRKG
jgi:hypothetical protein